MKLSYSARRKAPTQWKNNFQMQTCCLYFTKTVFRTLWVHSMELLPPALRNYCLQVRCAKTEHSKECDLRACFSNQQQLHECSLFDSEGSDGLRVFYWSKFSAPSNFAMEIRRSSPDRQERRLPGTNKVQRYSRNEQRYFMEEDEDMISLMGKSTSCWLM